MSSAEPDALLVFANALSAMVDELTPRLQQLGAEALAYQLKPHPGGPDLSEYAYGTDPATRAAVQMVALADSVRRVGLAFRLTDDVPVSTPQNRPRRLVARDADVDTAVARLADPPVYHDQPPLDQRLVDSAGADDLAPYPSGPAMAAGGYHRGGAIVGPDGRTYPLAVPYIAEDGMVYTADATARRDGVGVLDGADRGWQLVGTELGRSELPVAAGDEPGREATYTVVYEQHPDGRARAQLTFHPPASATASGGAGPDRHAVFAHGVLVPVALRLRPARSEEKVRT